MSPFRIRLAAEFAALYFGMPALFAAGVVPLHVLAALWIVAAACTVALLRSRRFDRRLLWNAAALRPWLGRVALSFLALAPPMLLGTWLLVPERFFLLVRERPLVWVLVMLLYPPLSVYPQGIVYRVFLFHRYDALFPSTAVRVAASAVAFSFLHIVLVNWVAPALTLIGGVLFAWTYARSRSALVAAVQHALFGCWIFTIGLGWFFYHGAVP